MNKISSVVGAIFVVVMFYIFNSNISYGYYWVSGSSTMQFGSAQDAILNPQDGDTNPPKSIRHCNATNETYTYCYVILTNNYQPSSPIYSSRGGALEDCPDQDGVEFDVDATGQCTVKEKETIEQCMGIPTNDLGLCALDLDDGDLKTELTTDFPPDIKLNECIGDRCVDSSVDGQVCGTGSDGALFCVNDPDSSCQNDANGNYLCSGGNAPPVDDFLNGGKTFDPQDNDVLNAFTEFVPEITETLNPDGSTTTSTTHSSGSTSHSTTAADGTISITTTKPNPQDAIDDDPNSSSVAAMEYEKGEDTFDNILGDFRGDLESTPLVNSLTNLSVPTGGGSCTPLTIDTRVAGVHEMTSHCQLINDIKPYMQPIMLLVWSFLSILLVFKL